MIVNLEIYKLNKTLVTRWCDKNKGKTPDFTHAISELSCATFCPAIVVAYWIGEAFNWPKEVVECIERLKVFYEYDTVLNKPEGASV